MADKIMIVAQGSAFMTNALVSSLGKAGYETSVFEPGISAFGTGYSDFCAIIIYAGDFVFARHGVLASVKEICAGEAIPLCIVGYEKELTEIKSVIPEHLISCEFKRPFDMKDLTNEILLLSYDNNERRKNKHILMVDDDPVYLKMMQDWLSLKYSVTSVRSGMQAITYIATHKPDLILLDYDMPIIPGPQVMEMIRSEHSSEDIPIIFLTGKSDRESVLKVMALKPQGYLLKTMNKEQIYETVEHFFSTNKWKNIE